MMSACVSLIFPTFNRKQTIVKVIDSYLRETSFKEIIFVDDGSTDGTHEYLLDLSQSYQGPITLRVLRHDTNRGLPAARNTGIAEATAEYLMMGEDDVVLSESYVSQLLTCLKKTDADIIAGRILYKRRAERFEETVVRCDKQKGPFMNYWLMSAFYSVPTRDHVSVPFLHSIALGKTALYKTVQYNPSYHAREETDFYLRVVATGAKIIYCPHTYCFHLEPDAGRGGGWSMGVLRYQCIATRNNWMLINQHYTTLKEWGMKGNKWTFTFLHLLNRMRIVYKYLRTSRDHTRKNA